MSVNFFESVEDWDIEIDSLDIILIPKRARSPSFFKKQLWQSKSAKPLILIRKFKVSRDLRTSSWIPVSQICCTYGSIVCIALNKSMIRSISFWKISAVSTLCAWKIFSLFFYYSTSRDCSMSLICWSTVDDFYPIILPSFPRSLEILPSSVMYINSWIVYSICFMMSLMVFSLTLSHFWDDLTSAVWAESW